MPTYLAPGVYVEEVSSGARPIEAVGTSTAAFIGVAPKADARLNEAVAINNWSQFLKEFCAPGAAGTPLAQAIFGFLMNGGRRCYVVNLGAAKAPLVGDASGRRGLDLIEPILLIAVRGNVQIHLVN